MGWGVRESENWTGDDHDDVQAAGRVSRVGGDRPRARARQL